MCCRTCNSFEAHTRLIFSPLCQLILRFPELLSGYHFLLISPEGKLDPIKLMSIFSGKSLNTDSETFAHTKNVTVTYTGEPIYSLMIGKDARYNQVSIRKNDHL